jgi:succinate dehydrogenase / fumarate reductase iron-sulfur subunit
VVGERDSLCLLDVRVTRDDRVSSSSCLIDEYAPLEGDTITLEPMTKFPVIRDLWVDRSRMFDALKRIKAWAPIDGLYDLGAGPRERPDDQAVRYTLSECMTCGCCLEACPQFLLVEDEAAWAESFIGAQATSQARLFNMHETGAQLKGDRLDTLMGPGGVSDCGNAQNCVKVCPKHIPLTESIASIGRGATVHAISKWFTGK